jgi:hypothetical protein
MVDYKEYESLLETSYTFINKADTNAFLKGPEQAQSALLAI